jgi:hypothetical protein
MSLGRDSGVWGATLPVQGPQNCTTGRESGKELILVSTKEDQKHALQGRIVAHDRG